MVSIASVSFSLDMAAEQETTPGKEALAALKFVEVLTAQDRVVAFVHFSFIGL